MTRAASCISIYLSHSHPSLTKHWYPTGWNYGKGGATFLVWWWALCYLQCWATLKPCTLWGFQLLFYWRFHFFPILCSIETKFVLLLNFWSHHPPFVTQTLSCLPKQAQTKFNSLCWIVLQFVVSLSYLLAMSTHFDWVLTTSLFSMLKLIVSVLFPKIPL